MYQPKPSSTKKAIVRNRREIQKALATAFSRNGFATPRAVAKKRSVLLCQTPLATEQRQFYLIRREKREIGGWGFKLRN
jgi:hypothetical protein